METASLVIQMMGLVLGVMLAGGVLLVRTSVVHIVPGEDLQMNDCVDNLTVIASLIATLVSMATDVTHRV